MLAFHRFLVMLGLSAIILTIAAGLFSRVFVPRKSPPRPPQPAQVALRVDLLAASTPAASPSVEPPSAELPSAESPPTSPSAIVQVEQETPEPAVAPAASTAAASTETTKLAARRPDWVVDAVGGEKSAAWPRFVSTLSDVDEGAVHQIVVTSGPWATQAECDAALAEKVRQAFDDYVRDFLHDDRAPRLLRYELAEIESRLVDDYGRFDETIVVSFGPMRQSHRLLEFDASFRRELSQRWRRVVAGSRLGQAGLTLGGVLSVLATFAAYFQLAAPRPNGDTGRRSRLLQAAMTATILAIVVVGIWLARQVLWL